MLDTLRRFLHDLTSGGPPPRFDEGDYRLAAAALLVHAIGIDGGVAPVERQKLHALLKARFELNDADTSELIATATQMEGEAVDLYGFTRLLSRSLDAAGRLRMVEMLWELIYADGRVNEFEDNLVWRAADLLGVSAQDRIALRRRVAGDPSIGDAE